MRIMFTAEGPLSQKASKFSGCLYYLNIILHREIINSQYKGGKLKGKVYYMNITDVFPALIVKTLEKEV